MSERHEYRELLKTARALGRMPADAEDAVAAVRVRLGAGSVMRSRRLVLMMAGGIAAAMAVVIGMFVMIPRKADAAEALQNAANATGEFRGWVHVTPVYSGGIFSVLKPRVESIHMNTAEGSIGLVASIYGTLLVQLAQPATREMRMYTALSGTVVISALEENPSSKVTRRAAEFPLRLADYLARFKERGLELPRVAEKVEEGLDRFDLSLSDDAKTSADQYPEMPDGQVTLWVDPQTKLFRKMTGKFDGVPVVMEYSYGAPEIRDIYDLGVPKTAVVVDGRAAKEDGKRPAVFDLPATEGLVKDESVDVKSLEARLQKRNDEDWGDFVSVECNQRAYLVSQEHAEGQLVISGREGGKAYYAVYLLAPAMVLFGGQGFPNGWPTPKLEEVDSQLRGARPIRMDVFDGKNAWHGEMSGRQLSSMQVKPTTQISAPTEVKMALNFWPSLKERPAQFGTSKSEVLRDPARPGLIVVQVEQTLPFALQKGAANYHSDTLYWLDPARDDLPVETVTHSNSSGGEKLDSASHTVYLEFARVADGRWYPSHWQVRGFSPPSTQPVQDDGYTDFRRQIFQDQKLRAEWYGDPSLRMTDSLPQIPATESTK